MSDECQELKNIKYQSMLLSNNEKNKITKSNIKNIDEIINIQKNIKSIKPWSKLNKLIRMQKINIYVDGIVEKHTLNENETKALKKYLKTCLDRKKLQRVKDITYDKITGVIKNIPGLIINKLNTRKFTLKNVDKKISTLKNMAPHKKKKKRSSLNKNKSKNNKSKNTSKDNKN